MLLQLLLIFAIINIACYLLRNKPYQIYKIKERAESFVLSDRKYEFVIVGSGLCGNFDAAHYRSNVFFNLHFPFGGSCTGVELICKSGKIPAHLIIETNYIYRGIDQRLLNEVLSPLPLLIKRVLPAFRLAGGLKSLIKVIFFKNRFYEIRKHKILDSLYQFSLNGLHKEYNKIPEEIEVRCAAENLKECVNKLHIQGCIVFLFEMPIDITLSNLPLASYQREIVKETFPKEKFNWIILDKTVEYNTEDGIHLLEDASDKVFSQLMSAIKNKELDTKEQ